MKIPFTVRSCSAKVAYATDAAAAKAKAESEAKYRVPMFVCRCQICRHRHLTSHRYSAGQRKQFRIAGKSKRGQS